MTKHNSLELVADTHYKGKHLFLSDSFQIFTIPERTYFNDGRLLDFNQNGATVVSRSIAHKQRMQLTPELCSLFCLNFNPEQEVAYETCHDFSRKGTHIDIIAMDKPVAEKFTPNEYMVRALLSSDFLKPPSYVLSSDFGLYALKSEIQDNLQRTFVPSLLTNTDFFIPKDNSEAILRYHLLAPNFLPMHESKKQDFEYYIKNNQHVLENGMIISRKI